MSNTCNVALDSIDNGQHSIDVPSSKITVANKPEITGKKLKKRGHDMALDEPQRQTRKNNIHPGYTDGKRDSNTI
jgi:hypothetical protein